MRVISFPSQSVLVVRVLRPLDAIKHIILPVIQFGIDSMPPYALEMFLHMNAGTLLQLQLVSVQLYSSMKEK